MARAQAAPINFPYEAIEGPVLRGLHEGQEKPVRTRTINVIEGGYPRFPRPLAPPRRGPRPVSGSGAAALVVNDRERNVSIIGIFL
jgi:hypothetical protein